MVLEPLRVPPNPNFVGRKAEIDYLEQVYQQSLPAILVVYGRRRIGKTELLEQCFRDRNILKFEGIEGKPKDYQITSFVQQLAFYASDASLKEQEIHSWRDALLLLSTYVENGQWIVYLEELQWLAAEETELIAELKYVWDNFFRRNSNLLLILCGSSPSFMIDHVLHSKSLYNRSQFELHLEEFSLPEAKSFLENYTMSEVLDAYLAVGGVPLYLSYLKKSSSIFLALTENSFRKGSFFSNEFRRIFASSLGAKAEFEAVIEFLSGARYATRAAIAKAIGAQSGGTLSLLLRDLEQCGFIDSYTPFNTPERTKLVRYCVADPYLRFYFRFIKGIKKNIDHGDYNANATQALLLSTFRQWLGYEYERLCRREHKQIAHYLGFSSVRYRHGSFFNRASQHIQGSQIDLLFEREDRVYTVCEVKYDSIANPKKLSQELFAKLQTLPQSPKRRFHTVLITGNREISKSISPGLFDNVFSLEEIYERKP